MITGMARRAVAVGVIFAAVRTGNGNDDGAKALASLRTNDTNETEANATWAGRFMLEMRDTTEYAGEYALDAQGKKLELIWFKYRENADQSTNVWRRSNWRQNMRSENLNDEVANEEQT